MFWRFHRHAWMVRRARDIVAEFAAGRGTCAYLRELERFEEILQRERVKGYIPCAIMEATSAVAELEARDGPPVAFTV